MSDTKKEHFVPRCYLENFATDRLTVGLFDKWKVEPRRNQRIINVAMENEFYDMDLAELLKMLEPEEYDRVKEDLKAIMGTDQWDDVAAIIGNKKYLEKDFFSKLESMYALVLESIIHKSYNGNAWTIRNCKCMSPAEKDLMSVFIAIQHVRTRRFRDTLDDMMTGAIQTMAYKRQLDGDNPLPKESFKVKMSPEHAKLQHSLIILDPVVMGHLVEILMNHIWVMCINKTNIPFYTSDDPVVKIPHKKDEGFKSFSGFASDGIEIAFPISPKLMLCLFDPKVYSQLFTDLQFYEITDPDEVTYYNWHQIHNCYRYVFSNNTDFHDAERFCVDYPEHQQYLSQIEVL